MTAHDRNAGDFGPGLRPVEWVMSGYLGLTLVLLVLFGRSVPRWPELALLHVAGIGVMVLLARTTAHTGRVAGLLRRLMPMALGPLLYTEVASLNDIFWSGRTFDPLIISAERTLFGTDPSQVLARMWPYPALSELLHLAYISYYALPIFLFGVLAAKGKWAGLERFLTVLSLAFTTCLLWFIALPVAGPFHTFGPLDPPAPGSVMPQLVHSVLESASSVGSAFPSSHVAVAWSVLASAAATDRMAARVLAVVVPLLTIGTVYGGFHYVVDGLAGMVWSGLSFFAASWFFGRLRGPRAAAEPGDRVGPPGHGTR